MQHRARHIFTAAATVAVSAALAAGTLTSPAEGEPAPAGVDASRLSVAQRADTRPNVIVVLTDDMRTDDLDFMPAVRTLISSRGMEFTDAISPHPLCCPARAELVTGQYAQNNGVRHNDDRYGGYHRLDPSNTVATWFNGQGYNAGFIGKYLNEYESWSPRDPGWAIWEPLTGTPTDYYSFRFFSGEQYAGDYVTNRIEEKTNAAIRAMSAAGKPFLIYANHVAPHERQPAGSDGLTPAPSEPQFAGYAASVPAPPLAIPSWNRHEDGGLPQKMKRHAYSASVIQEKWLARVRALQSVDEAIASMFATLTATGEAQNTYVVFTSDNGYSLGERKLQKKNNLVAETLAVPMLVVGPGVVAGKSKLPVTLVDLVATIADLAHVSPRLRIDGASFKSALFGGDPKWRDTTLVQTGDDYNPVKDKRLEHKGWGLRGVRTGRYTYARDVNTGELMLFDHAVDRYEMHNVARNSRYREVVRVLDRRTVRLMHCKGAGCNKRFGPDPKPKRP